MEPIKHKLHMPDDCEKVEIIDKKTGFDNFFYLCKKPFVSRIAHYRKHNLHFWTDIFLVATVAILLLVIGSLYIFNKTRLTNAIDFKVNYDQSQLINGANVKFEIAYKNTSKRLPVSDAVVLIKFPSGLQNITVSSPNYNPLTQTITLGELQPQDQGSFEVGGLLLANIGEKEKFLFVLSYQNPAGQAQQEFSTREFTVEQSVVKTTLKLPGTILIGSEFPSSLEIENQADRTFENLELKLVYPDNFETAQDVKTIINALEAGEKRTAEFSGNISQGNPGVVEFQALLTQHYQEKDYILSRTTVKANVARSKFSMGFAGSEKNQNLNPGDQTEIQLALENNESQPINDLKLELKVEGDYSDYDFLQKTYGDRYASQSISFPQLSALEAGKTWSDKITVAALPYMQVKSAPTAPAEITIYAKASYRLGDSPDVLNQTSRKLMVPINSTLSVKSFGIFVTKDGDQIGVGSIPPRPGEYTAYWAIVELANGVNKVRNVTMKADFPANVEYDGLSNVTVGTQVRKVGGQNTLEWYIPELAAYDGVLSAPGQARIQLAIVPDESDIGKILPLLTNIRFTAVDDRTGYMISASGKEITTAIFPDPAQNKVAQ